jgi:hypothetical protein
MNPKIYFCTFSLGYRSFFGSFLRVPVFFRAQFSSGTEHFTNDHKTWGGTHKARSEKQHLIEVQDAHSRQIRQVLSQSERADLLEVSYPDLVLDPQPVIEQLERFLGSRFRASPAVSACVKPKLFRNR